MTSRERVTTVIGGGRADRVPVSLHNFQMAVHRSGRPFDEVLRSGELLAEAMIREWLEFRHDLILLEIGTACSAEAMGVGVIYAADHAPVATAPVIESLDDVCRFEIPPFESRPSWQVTLDAVRLIRRELADHVAICGRADQGPFSLAAMLRGMDEFMLDIGTGEQDEQMHALMELTGEVVFRYAAAMRDAGADSTSIGESFAGPDVMSPADYRRLAWPHERRVIERIQNELGLPLHLHICGRAAPIIEDMMNTSARVLEIDQKADLRHCREVTRGRCVLHGNVDPARCRLGTPAEIAALTRTALDEGAHDGGFIVGPGCALPGDTPPDNIRALVETARAHGAG